MNARRGFTVVELMAALGLATVLLLTARAALSALADSRAAAAATATTLELAGVGHRRLTEAFLMAEAVESGAPPFFGDAQSASFRTRCRVAGGWIEPCDAFVLIRESEGVSIVQLRFGQRGAQDVLRLRGAVRLRYLERDASAAEWRDEWGASIRRPLAIAVVGERDTVVYRGGGP